MKNYKLPLMGLALVLLITSCKKEDVQQNSSKTPSANTKGSWNSLTNWSTAKLNDSTTTYFSQVADTSISTNITKSGLVLVFKKNGNTIQSLPFEDNSTGTFWYYQISKGALRINASNNAAGGQSVNGQAFSYLIFTPEQISALTAKGKTKFDLMQLSYNEALELSK